MTKERLLLLKVGDRRSIGASAQVVQQGKPRNPAEPGLEELLKRAESFL